MGAIPAFLVLAPHVDGSNDTAAVQRIIDAIGADTGAMQVPFVPGSRMAVNSMTIPANVTIDNTMGSGIKVNSGQTLTVLGPVLSKPGETVFFGPGTTSFAGNLVYGDANQILTADGLGGTSWQDPAGAGGTVNVESFATGGDGSFGDPWTGWDTEITWAERTTYQFGTGVFEYSVSPNFGLPGLRLQGTGQSFLQYTGVAVALKFDGTTYSGGGYVFDVEAKDLTIDGGTTGTVGVFAQSIHHSRFSNITVRNVKAGTGLASFYIVASVLNKYEDLQQNGADDANAGWPAAGAPALTSLPPNGMVFITGSAGILGTIGCNSSTIINPNIAGCSSHGINSNGLISSVILGGAVELNGGYGIFLQGGGQVTVQGTEVEHNTLGGVRTSACNNLTVQGCFMFNNSVVIDAGVTGTAIYNGSINSVSNSGYGTKLRDFTYGFSGGAIVDLGPFTSIDGVMATSATPDSYRIAHKSVTPWLLEAASPSVPQITIQGHLLFTDGGLGDGANIISYDSMFYPPDGSTVTAKWRMIFRGSWYSAVNGAAQVQPATIVELTKASPTLSLGSGITVTGGLFGGVAYPAATSNSGNIGFNGTLEIIADDYNVAASNSIDVKGAILTSGGVSHFSKGTDVASATAIVPTGNLFHVTGTTTITSITATGIGAGTVIMIIFDGILTFTDGSNLKLAGDFVTSASDSISLVYDGSNFYELCRSVN